MKIRSISIVLLLLSTSRAWAEDGRRDEAASEGWWKSERLFIEWYGGVASVSAPSLNALVTYDNQVQQHMFDNQLDALQAGGQIQSWGSESDGARRPVESSWSTGLGARLRLNATFSLSFGLQYLSAGGSDELRFRYARLEHNTDERIEELSYSPYTLSVEAYAPLVGINLGKRLGEKVDLEGFFRGGPLFARFDYVSDWDYAFAIQGPSMGGYGLIFTTDGRLDGQGKGTGVALDLGMRFQYVLFNRVGVFVEGGYAYQSVKSLSGSGNELSAGAGTSWEGEWAVIEDTISAPWGAVDLERPTNSAPNGNGPLRSFELDLSGFQLRLGVSFRI